ncbi:hypothetical protein RhiirC2_862771 [Rhizophagus irregularis]|uniref:Uncharacterized protein n=1 Tax=Rhizophagus irregularis TaxID=588596 RepID=A0A2N1NQP7_9GLOM|nr:hypothetical protein RhiirC2_862771 [Rhizophagus irregularis]
MEGSNYYAPGGMNSGRRNDNRYQQQQQYSYERPNLFKEHQLFQESQLRNNKNNNNNNGVYNYVSHLSPDNQPSIYPPPSLQDQHNIHKSSQMNMMQNHQFPSSSNKPYKEYPPSSNRPYNEFPPSSNYLINGNISPSTLYNHLMPSPNFPLTNKMINERPSQPLQNKGEFSKFPPPPSYNQLKPSSNFPSSSNNERQNKEEFSKYSPPLSYNQIPSSNFPNNQIPSQSKIQPPSYNQMVTPSPGITTLNPNDRFSPNLPINLHNPSSNLILNPSPITLQQNEKNDDKIQGQVDHSIPSVERSLTQLTSLEQVWDMPLVNDGKPTWKFWFCKIFIILLILSCSSIGVSIKLTLNNLGIRSSGLVGSNETNNENCNIPPDCGKSCPLDGKKPSKNNS